MATSVLDAPSSVPAAPARRPVPVLALAAVCGLESVALLAGGLTGLDGLSTAAPQPSAPLLVAVLGGLAGWVVLCAGSALAALEGGRRLAGGLACAEVAAVAALFVVGLLTPVVGSLPATLPVPALALLALAVPVGKLLLTSAPATLAWAQAAPPRVRTAAPGRHPRLQVATVALIGVALGALVVTTPVAGELPPVSSVAGR
ncbi:hypothetical protein [Geodermatophilus amargosae]|uniref:hypothetical protein n=1 Tax=Geodermatophilus amargosae TaxID=1296565 RepID=UPI0034DFCAF3